MCHAIPQPVNLILMLVVFFFFVFPPPSLPSPSLFLSLTSLSRSLRIIWVQLFDLNERRRWKKVEKERQKITTFVESLPHLRLPCHLKQVKLFFSSVICHPPFYEFTLCNYESTFPSVSLLSTIFSPSPFNLSFFYILSLLLSLFLLLQRIKYFSMNWPNFIAWELCWTCTSYIITLNVYLMLSGCRRMVSLHVSFINVHTGILWVENMVICEEAMTPSPYGCILFCLHEFTRLIHWAQVVASFRSYKKLHQTSFSLSLCSQIETNHRTMFSLCRV